MGTGGIGVVGGAGRRAGMHGSNGSSVESEVGELVRRGLDVVPGVVAALASRFPRHVDRAELVRAGSLGVVEAACRFDPARGVPFERFAAWRVRGAVLDAVRATDWTPRSVRSAARRIDLVEGALTARFGRRPTSTEIGRELGLEAAEVERTRATVAQGVLSRLESDDDTGGGPADESQPDPAASLERAELLGYLHDAIDSLSDRHRRVILGLYDEGRSTVDLAVELGVSRSRVSQLRAEALGELRRRISGCYPNEGGVV